MRRPSLISTILPYTTLFRSSNNGGQHQPVNSHGVSYAFDQIVIRRDHSQGLMIPVRNLVACYLLGTHKVFLSENIQKCRSLRGLPAFLNPEMLEQESVHMIGQLGSIFSDSPGDGI